MTEKRFTLHKGVDTLNIMDNTKFHEHIYINKSSKDMELLVKVLNALHEENQQYKALLQDMGLLMSDDEVNNLRNEMADKLIKPLLKENGFDVDVDTTDGFTIIPKGD